MAASVSIASEYYKVQDLWRAADSQKGWRLAVWVAKYEDVDIIDKFMEIERSPIGTFGDVFFRMESIYDGADDAYNEILWQEYLSWFAEKVPEKYDVLGALKKDGMLLKEYVPDSSQPHTLNNLWKEFIRLKSCVKGLKGSNVCIYFPPTSPAGAKMTDWFGETVKTVPDGVRLATIDFADRRKVKLPASESVLLLKPKLKMAEAIRNEMDKECGNFDATNPESLYTKQIRTVMDCTVKADASLLKREVNKLFSYARQMNNEQTEMSTPLIAAQAFYSIRDFDTSLFYVDKTLKEAEEKMTPSDMSAYSVWKAAMFQKAAILVGNGKRDAAIELYDKVAKVGVTYGDLLYTMEGYRMSGFMHYEKSEYEEAFIKFLLALETGSHLDMATRRSSTFVLVANLALHVGESIRTPEDMHILEKQLSEWLGEDWRSIVFNKNMAEATKRHKQSIFN